MWISKGHLKGPLKWDSKGICEEHLKSSWRGFINLKSELQSKGHLKALGGGFQKEIKRPLEVNF